MQPTLRCYFCNRWLRERLKRIGAPIVCCRAEESVFATEAEGCVRPCTSEVSVAQWNATSFRSPKTKEISRREQKKKGLTELVKPFLVQLKPSRRWRKWRDSNPRGLAPKRFSRPPRCDRFDTLPYFLPLYQLSTRMSNCFWVFVGGNRVLLLLFICVAFKIVVSCFALYNNEIM